MLIFFFIKTIFCWAFVLIGVYMLISFIYRSITGKLKHLRFSDKPTLKELIGLMMIFILIVLMLYFFAIPYAIDTYLYITNTYPTEYAKVVKVLYYTRGVGRGSILIEDGYRTIFSINGKEVTMKVEKELQEGTTYRIQYLPNIKYVLNAW
jgi:hypothetical protein